MKKITLSAWAAMNFDPPPQMPTLRAWAKRRLISPKPQKIGRVWMVHPDAEYLQPPKPAPDLPDNISPRVRAILGRQTHA